MANISHLQMVTGGRYEAHLQAHRVDNPYSSPRYVRGLGTKDLCPHRSASGQGPGSGTLTGAGLCLATRLLPVETWRLPLETGHLGSSSGEACSVGLSSLGTRSPGLVQHAWILALRAQVLLVTSATAWARRPGAERTGRLRSSGSPCRQQSTSGSGRDASNCGPQNRVPMTTVYISTWLPGHRWSPTRVSSPGSIERHYGPSANTTVG